jgi:hypothetical protein
MTWNPKESDIEWLQNLFTSLKENGTWAIPATGQVFVKHGNKLTLTSETTGGPDEYRSEEAQADMFHKVSVVGKKIGIEVDKL